MRTPVSQGLQAAEPGALIGDLSEGASITDASGETAERNHGRFAWGLRRGGDEAGGATPGFISA